MGTYLDLTNVRFGRLVAIKRDDSSSRTKWLCRCDCGNTKSIMVSHLRSGASQSCGCLQKERNIKSKTIHGGKGTSLYNRWKSIRQRCYNPKNNRYVDYGARGITVCDEWNKFSSFSEWSIKSGYNESLDLDRIDNSKGYSPDNCRWVSKVTNNRNRRNTSKIDDIPLKEFSELYNIKYSTVRSRYYELIKNNKEVTTTTILNYANQLPT